MVGLLAIVLGALVLAYAPQLAKRTWVYRRRQGQLGPLGHDRHVAELHDRLDALCGGELFRV